MAISLQSAITISSPWMAVKGGKKRNMGILRVSAARAGNMMDQYRILRVQPGASEKEIKKAFRRLALQYHPDVCKGSNCGVQFHRINEAYDIVISSLRASNVEERRDWVRNGGDQRFREMYDAFWDSWEEWMGWEGAAS